MISRNSVISKNLWKTKHFLFLCSCHNWLNSVFSRLHLQKMATSVFTVLLSIFSKNIKIENKVNLNFSIWPQIACSSHIFMASKVKWKCKFVFIFLFWDVWGFNVCPSIVCHIWLHQKNVSCFCSVLFLEAEASIATCVVLNCFQAEIVTFHCY